MIALWVLVVLWAIDVAQLLLASRTSWLVLNVGLVLASTYGQGGSVQGCVLLELGLSVGASFLCFCAACSRLLHALACRLPWACGRVCPRLRRRWWSRRLQHLHHSALMLLPMSSFVSEPRSESETSFSKAGKPCKSMVMVTSESRACNTLAALLVHPFQNLCLRFLKLTAKSSPGSWGSCGPSPVVQHNPHAISHHSSQVGFVP